MGKLLFAALLVFFLLFGAYLLLELAPSNLFGGVDRVRIVSERLALVSREAWDFGRPILQLVIVLLILEWILRKLGEIGRASCRERV